MYMSKPTNSIARVQLPGENEQRPIIPYAVGYSGDNDYQATLNELSEDKIITTQWPDVYISSFNNYSNTTVYFGEVRVPQLASRGWSITYNISIDKPFGDTKARTGLFSKVTITSWGGIQLYDWACITADNAKSSTHPSQSSSVTSQPVSSHVCSLMTPAGIQAGYGHLLGLALNSGDLTGYSITVTVLEAVNCYPTIWNRVYTANDITQGSYIRGTVTQNTNTGIQNDNINSKGNTVQVGGYNDTSNKRYLTGTTYAPVYYWNTSQTTLDVNTNFYIQGSYLYGTYAHFNGVSANWLRAGDTNYYDNYINYYDADNDENYSLYFPSKSGTIALKSDITNIAIEDLTNVTPTPTEPEELYCSEVGDTHGDPCVIKFSKGFIPTRIDCTDRYTTGEWYATFTYNGTNLVADECYNCSVDGWSVEGPDTTAYDKSSITLLVTAPTSGNQNQVTVTGQFTYKPGDWLYEL